MIGLSMLKLYMVLSILENYEKTAELLASRGEEHIVKTSTIHYPFNISLCFARLFYLLGSLSFLGRMLW